MSCFNTLYHQVCAYSHWIGLLKPPAPPPSKGFSSNGRQQLCLNLGIFSAVTGFLSPGCVCDQYNVRVLGAGSGLEYAESVEGGALFERRCGRTTRVGNDTRADEDGESPLIGCVSLSLVDSSSSH